MIGRTVSHYRILSELGSGGMGVVYRAEDLNLGRHVAVKFLSTALNADHEARCRFLHEAKAAAALDHSGICTVYDSGEADGQPFIAMALIEGRTLRDRIAQGPLPISEALYIAAQVAEALQEAHTRGVVHRDIKPANIMLTPKGQVKVMDFGLALLAGASQLTRVGTTLGTIAYLSPEQARGEGADHRSDLWSLGVVLYEMVCGHRPFRGERDASLLQSLQCDEPEPLTGLRTGVPLELDRVVGKCLAKDCGRRYQHADELAVDLQRLRSQLDATQSLARAMPAPSRPHHRHRRWLVPVVAALALGAAAWAILPRVLHRAGHPGPMALAVMDFRDLSTPTDPTVTASMSGLLQVGLVEASPIRVISPEYLLDLRRRTFGAARGPIADDQALEVARQAGATLLLCGQLTEQNGLLAVMWRLVDTRDGSSVVARRADGELLATLADRIIGDVMPALAQRGGVANGGRVAASPVADITTTSPVAYRHFATGQLHFEAWRYAEASDEFRRAVQVDSTFALASFWLSRAIDAIAMNVKVPEERSALERAWRHRERLGEADRMRVEAFRLYLAARNVEASAAFEAILARWPDDRQSLVDLVTAYIWEYSLDKAEPIAVRGAALYPDDISFQAARATILLYHDRAAEAVEIGREFLRRRGDESSAWANLGDAQLYAGLRDSAVVSYSRSAELGEPLPRVWLAYTGGDLDQAIAIADSLANVPGLAPQVRIERLAVGPYVCLASMLAEAGRYRKALAAHDRADSLDTANPTRRGRRMFLLLRLGCPAEVLAWSDDMARLRDTPTARWRSVAFRPFALALMDSLPQARAVLAGMPACGEATIGGLARVMTGLATASVALAEKKPALALDALAVVAEHGVISGSNDVRYRELLARAYVQSARLADAAKVHTDLLRIYGGHALSHFELGRIYEGMARPAEARREYERFLVMWARADADAPELLEARRRLAALGPGT